MIDPRAIVNEYSFIALLIFIALAKDCPAQTAAPATPPALASYETLAELDAYDAAPDATLSLTEDHYRFGKHALEWQWNGNDNAFTTSAFRTLSQEESPLAYGDHFPSSPTFFFSVYNETAREDSVTFFFEREGANATYFSLPLSFTGWRRFWVPFYEMQGSAPERGVAVEYDHFRVSSSAERGMLIFDDIIFSQYQDDRHQYPDLLVPFIKREQTAADDHWMPRMENLTRLQQLDDYPLTPAIRQDLQKVEQRLDEQLAEGRPREVKLPALEKKFRDLGIEEKGGTVVGPPLTYRQEQEYYDEDLQGPQTFNDVKDLGQVMEKLAEAHAVATPADRAEIESMFLLGTRYFLDQGWQAGASGGTRHHVGYAVREITRAFYLMRQTLAEKGLLGEVGASLQWLYNLGMVLGDEQDFHVNIDYLNTQAFYHLLLIFLSDSQEQQAALLDAYSNYLSVTLAQEDEEWGFKPDGTAWHHNGHYPAYGIGAFQNVPKVIYALSGTAFRIGERGHSNFKRAFLATSLYTYGKDWGFGNAGRHPLEDNSIRSLRKQYLQMVYSGDPGGTSAIDRDVAGAYLNIWGAEDQKDAAAFRSAGIPGAELTGYFTFPYAATAVQRRRDWAAIIKGYSKYVWASEIYVASNRYGRYPANGTVQVLNRGGEEGSGFEQAGWDWNRFPGATVINLPYEELETEMPLLMFRSGESFAGAVSLGDNGVFGMILNESKGSNADGPQSRVGFSGKLYAKKSVFSFGDKLICIGTDISSVDPNHPVQTNLFQLALNERHHTVHLPAKQLKGLPASASLGGAAGAKPQWLVDPYGNGYHILSAATPVEVRKQQQHSYHNKYSLRTGAMNPKGKGAKETGGDFATAWLDHGTRPAAAAYRYVIYPGLSDREVKKFGSKVAGDDSYTILRADSTAHIVADRETATTGYVIFRADTDLGEGTLERVSAPALVMARRNGDAELTLSAVQPDLNFPEYRPGKYRNYSRPVTLQLTVRGTWRVSPTDFIESVETNSDRTLITLRAVDGLPRQFTLTKP